MNIPQNIEAERSLIAAAMLNLNATMLEAGDLEPEAFFSPTHQLLWRNLLALEQAGVSADVTVLAARCGAEWQANQAAIQDAICAMGLPAMAGEYKAILRDRAHRRQVIAAAHALIGHAQGDDSLDESLALMNDAMQIKAARGAVHMMPLIKLASEQIESDLARERLAGLDIGYHRLNRTLGGLRKQAFVLLAARPSNGKTTLAMNIATNVAQIERTPVLVFSLEQSAVELTKRTMASAAGVNIRSLLWDKQRDVAVGKLANASAQLAKLPLYIDDRGGLTVAQIRAEARRMKAKHNIGLVVIDYIGLIRRAHQRMEQIDHISRTSADLKLMAKELDIPVLVLSQLNRSMEIDGRRPRCSDLRDSGSLEQDADAIILLSREPKDEELPKKLRNVFTPEELARMSIIDVAKNRDGETAYYPFWFDKETTTFREVDSQQ